MERSALLPPALLPPAVQHSQALDNNGCRLIAIFPSLQRCVKSSSSRDRPAPALRCEVSETSMPIGRCLDFGFPRLRSTQRWSETSPWVVVGGQMGFS